MISIGKLTNAEAAVEYLQHAIKDSALDYYTNGEAPGRWDGVGAQHLNLSGEVTPDQLRNLLNGFDPTTGNRLAKEWDSQRIIAFDVTFSAPKSVSLLYALGDDTTRKAVLEAHDAGVTAALQYLQKNAGYARLYNPAIRKVEPVAGDMVMPRFLHRTARPVTDPTTGETTIDPQLHTHVPIPTWVCRPDGSWSALLSEPLYQHAAAAGAVGQAEYRKVLINRLGVEAEVMPNGTFEIIGITEAQRREFSKRRQQIEVAQAAFDIHTKSGFETATLATREGKHEVGVGPNLIEEWRERGIAVGLDREQLQRLLHGRQPAREFQLSPTVITELVGVRGLTEEAATFSRREVIRRIAAAATDGLAYQEIEAIADQILESEHVTPLGRKVIAVEPQSDVQTEPSPGTDNDHGRNESERVVLVEQRYSTPEMVALEQRMLELALTRRHSGIAMVPDSLIQSALDERPTLTPEQRAMVHAICSKGDGIVVVEGVAGAGKTFALDACREAFEASGHTVIGYALAGRAAKTLEEETAIPSHTIHSAIQHLLNERLPEKAVIIVDEAGMVGDRQMAQLMELTARDDAKLVLCGDSRQLQPIDAGSPFRAMGEHLGKIELQQSFRHSELWERVALGLIREGEIPLAVDMYRRQERIAVSKTVLERRQQIVGEALQSRAEGYDTVMFAKTRDETTAINELTRAVLHGTGELAGETVVIGGREFQIGDQVICTRPKHRLGIVNGLRGEVSSVDPSRNRITLRTESGDVVIDGGKYEHVDYAYALTAHKAQGMTTDIALVAGSETASREWAYSVMSRARVATRYFALEVPVTRDLDGIRHGRAVEPELERRLVRSWSRSEAKDSTLDYELQIRR